MITLEEQLNNYRSGFPYLDVIAPATVYNGILQLGRPGKERAIECYTKYLKSNGTICKFVPASGAATRMFKSIYEGLDIMRNSDEPLPEDHPCSIFLNNLGKIPLLDAEDLLAILLEKDGLNLGNTPKGLIRFHDYGNIVRTPFEEHMVEGAYYAKEKNGRVNIHYTVSKEHLKHFKGLLANMKDFYEQSYGCKYMVSFSLQDPATDMVAVDSTNNPFVKPDGKILYRPAGHGALISNLNSIKENIIVIKNIDNVTVENRLSDTTVWKKILIGKAVELQNQLFEYANKLSANDAVMSKAALKDCASFLKKNFSIVLPEHLFDYENNESAKYDKLRTLLYDIVNRPLRVCGMVKNQGEPGGGPYIVRESDGTTSLQILEAAQLNRKDSHIDGMVAKSTHFNPVDIVCAVYDHKGNKFDLEKYIDPSTGFISEKSYEGHPIKAQELPGLWNGAMSKWNTLFVEVPLSTFNPVKSVLDLLRPAHRVK